MRLATVRIGDSTRAVAVVEGGAIDLGARVGRPALDVGQILRDGWIDEARSAAEAGDPDVDLAKIRWLPPVPRPAHIVCAGVNYVDHRGETKRDPVDHPTLFLRTAQSQTGHDEPIVRPKVSTKLDYEGEIAVIIGRGGRYVSEDRALDHVFGVSCYNDGSVRDFQRHTSQWTPGKNFPRTGAFGPAVVTADEVDIDDLELITRVNGEELQRARSKEMIFGVPSLIAYITTFLELQPGDVIVTGTPGGVGVYRQPPRFLTPGDVTEVEISGVGVLRNVVAEG